MERLEMDAALADGSLVHVRSVGPGDRQALLRFLDGLSEQTRALGRVDSEAGRRLVERLSSPPGASYILAFREVSIIGMAGYRPEASGRAEASVVISDDYQGKGLGTILFRQLMEGASDAGIPVLEGLVAPSNYKLIDVVRRLGLPTEQKIEGGLIRVSFPTSLSPDSLAFFEGREAVAAAAAMEKFFRPRSVAVIGASRERGTIGGELFWNILRSGFTGTVYPVNRSAKAVQSVAAYPSVLDCPEPVDIAFVAVPARAVASVAEECARKGAKGLVVISAGFAESGGEGGRLQHELAQLCRDSGMRLIGPNCMGIVNTDPAVNLNAQFSPLKPDRGRMGFLSQSGALGIAVIDHANNLGLGMSSFVSVGNKADISGNDLIMYWEGDDNTDVILLYLESFGNPRKFARIARRVARKKPIIAVKSGRSAAGFRATQSHTGAMVSASDVTVDALFRQSGVIRTDSLAEMFDVAALLSTQPVPKGSRVAVVTNAGGAGILVTDACEDLGLEVVELSQETQAGLRGFLNPDAGVKNPVDMIASATPGDYSRAIKTVSRDPQVDSIIVIFVPPIAVRPEDVAREILSAQRDLRPGQPIVSIFMASHGTPSILSDGTTRIPSYPFPEAAALALSRAVQYGTWLAQPEGAVRQFPDARRTEATSIVARALGDGGRWLEPEEAENLLGCYGIPLARTVRAATAEEAAHASSQIGGRVALKAVARGLVHKTEAGAVKLNLMTEEEVRTAAEEMRRSVASAGYEVEAFLVQEMLSGAVEMLVGVTHDPLFGPVVACGAGGVLVELLKDVSVRLTPLTEKDASSMIRSLRTFPLLNGYRGGPRYDVAALEDVVLRLGRMVDDVAEIAEVDLNPVMVGERGAKVVDFRIRVAEVSPPARRAARD